MRRRVRQPGFALLLALVLVLLAGVALAGVARRSLVGAVEARQAVEDLQRRWAVASLRKTFLPRTERLLEAAERGDAPAGADAHGHPPRPERRERFRLAGLRVELVVTDEQAKLNVNPLVRQAGRAEAQSLVRRLVREVCRVGPREARVALRPLAAEVILSDAEEAMPPLGSYGQVFEAAGPEVLLGSARRPGLAAAVTCWGSGTVNIRRAPREVVMQACARDVGRAVVGRLLAERESGPYRPLEAMLKACDDIDDRDANRLGDRLTDVSTCHGLWIVVRGAQRTYTSLAVAATAPPRPASKGREESEDPGEAAREAPLPEVLDCATFEW